MTDHNTRWRTIEIRDQNNQIQNLKNDLERFETTMGFTLKEDDVLRFWARTIFNREKLSNGVLLWLPSDIDTPEKLFYCLSHGFPCRIREVDL